MPLTKAGLFKRNCSSPVSHQSGESHLLRGLNPDSSAHLIGNLIISDVDERKLKLASERAGLLWWSCAFPLLCKSWASPTGWLEGLLKIQWEKQRCALVSLVTLSPVTPADKRHRACLMNNVTWNIHDLFLMESSNNVKRESCNLQISHSNRRSNLFWFWTEDSKRNAPSEKHTSNIRIKIPHVQHRRGLWQPAKVLNVIGKNRKKQPISFQSVLLTPQCNFFSNQFGNNQPGCMPNPVRRFCDLYSRGTSFPRTLGRGSWMPPLLSQQFWKIILNCILEWTDCNFEWEYTDLERCGAENQGKAAKHWDLGRPEKNMVKAPLSHPPTESPRCWIRFLGPQAISLPSVL